MMQDPHGRLFWFLLILFFLPSCAKGPPIVEKRPHVTNVHGKSLADDYFWLREKSDPRVLDYLRQEDAYAQTGMKPTAGLQEKLYREELSHVQQTDQTFPFQENGYFYYSKTLDGLQYPVYCRKRGSMAASEEVFFD